jgi:hypothetical protein
MKWKSSDRDDKKSDIAEAMMRAVHSRARNTQHSRLNNAKAAFDVSWCLFSSNLASSVSKSVTRFIVSMLVGTTLSMPSRTETPFFVAALSSQPMIKTQRQLKLYSNIYVLIPPFLDPQKGTLVPSLV